MTINIRGLDIPVDIRTEIESYNWERENWKDDRLIACSPFRDERNPSFAVNLENGTFIDSGGDGDYRKGNLVKLLSFLNGESYAETEDHLITLYSPQFGDLNEMTLPDVSDWETTVKNDKTFDKEALQEFAFKHPYLENRGIPFNVQRAFDIGFDPATKSVVIPWHNMKGEIVSWKHRKVTSKVFWYVKGGQPIRDHLYGIHWVVKRKAKTAWIVESEIDALTLWSNGIPAVAIGTSILSKAKRDLILKSGIEKLVIATDNDEDGEKGKRSIIEQLSGFVVLSEVDWTGRKEKDINDVGSDVNDLRTNEILLDF